MARFAEYVEIVDRLLSHERSSFEGPLLPRPGRGHESPPGAAASRPPIVDRRARRQCCGTRRYADSWNSLSFAQSFGAAARRDSRAHRAGSTTPAPPSAARRRRSALLPDVPTRRHRASGAAHRLLRGPRTSSSTWWAASRGSASRVTAHFPTSWKRSGPCSRKIARGVIRASLKRSGVRRRRRYWKISLKRSFRFFVSFSIAS